MKAGKHVDIPVYDFVTSSRTAQSIPIAKADVVLVDGILIFYHPGAPTPKLRNTVSKIFCQALGS